MIHAAAVARRGGCGRRPWFAMKQAFAGGLRQPGKLGAASTNWA